MARLYEWRQHFLVPVPEEQASDPMLYLSDVQEVDMLGRASVTEL
jgi:hypothetical protein